VSNGRRELADIVLVANLAAAIREFADSASLHGWRGRREDRDVDGSHGFTRGRVLEGPRGALTGGPDLVHLVEVLSWELCLALQALNLGIQAHTMNGEGILREGGHSRGASGRDTKRSVGRFDGRARDEALGALVSGAIADSLAVKLSAATGGIAQRRTDRPGVIGRHDDALFGEACWRWGQTSDERCASGGGTLTLDTRDALVMKIKHVEDVT